MRLAVNLGYFGMGLDADNLVVAQEADRLGYAVAWVAEAYGPTCPPSWVGSPARPSTSASARPSCRSRPGLRP